MGLHDCDENKVVVVSSCGQLIDFSVKTCCARTFSFFHVSGVKVDFTPPADMHLNVLYDYQNLANDMNRFHLLLLNTTQTSSDYVPCISPEPHPKPIFQPSTST